MKTVGERIRQAREGKGLSGDDLARLAGYKTQSGIGNLENRAGGSGGKRLAKIADALDVTTDWLLNGPDADAPPYKTRLSNTVVQMGGAQATNTPANETTAAYRIESTKLSAAFREIAHACMALPPGSRNIAASLLNELALRPDNFATITTAFEAVMNSPNRQAA